MTERPAQLDAAWRGPAMTREVLDVERELLERYAHMFIPQPGTWHPTGVDNRPGREPRITNGPSPFISTAWPRAERRAREAVPQAGGRQWFKISNITVDEATVHIFDEIGFWGVTAQDFADEISKVNSGIINVHINSPGGEVFDGLAIMNTLRQHKAEVRVFVDGLAASAASFIAVGAAAPGHLSIARNAEMMIHDAMGWAVGNASDMRDLAKRLDKVSDNIADIYAERAGGDVSTWRAAMLAETWFTGAEAVAAGLADKVTGATEEADKVSDRWDLSVFAHAGRKAAPAPADVVPVNGMRGAEDQAEDTPDVQPVDENVSSTDDVAQSDESDGGHDDPDAFLPAWPEGGSSTTDRAATPAWGGALTAHWGR